MLRGLQFSAQPPFFGRHVAIPEKLNSAQPCPAG